jgi:ferredoxin
MANNHPTFQVNDNCMGCMLCTELMPAFFQLHENTLLSNVICQPKTNEEYSWFCEAANDCPANAIKEIKT